MLITRPYVRILVSSIYKHSYWYRGYHINQYLLNLDHTVRRKLSSLSFYLITGKTISKKGLGI